MSNDKAHESADKSVTNVQKSASNFDAIFRKKFKELKDDQESKGNSSITFIEMRCRMFADSMSGSPSAEAIATAKAATDVVEGKVPLSTACSMYNVREQAIIKFIIDSTEYDTVISMGKK